MNKCNTSHLCILTGKFIFGIVLIIQGHLQGEKSISRSNMQKYHFPTNQAREKCNTSFLCDFDWIIHFWYHFEDSRSSSRSKVNFKVKYAKIYFFNKLS